MESAENHARAIRAALAYTGWTQKELADAMEINEDTLGRKLRRPETLTLRDLIMADLAVRWSAHMQEARR